MNIQPVTLQLHSLAFQQGYQANHLLPRAFINTAQRAIATSSYDVSFGWKSVQCRGLHKAHTLAKIADYHVNRISGHSLINKTIDATNISARYMAEQNPAKGKLWLHRAMIIAHQLTEDGTIKGLELFAGLQLFLSPTSDQIDKLDAYMATCDEEDRLITLDAIDHIPADQLQVFLSKIKLLIRQADAHIDLAYSTHDQLAPTDAIALYDEAFELCKKTLEDFNYRYEKAEREIEWAERGDVLRTFEDVTMRNKYLYLEYTLQPIIQDRLNLFS